MGRKPGLFLTPACPQPVTSAQTWAIAMGAVGEAGTFCPEGAALSPGGGGEHTASRPRAGLAASTLLLANVRIKLLWDWLPILGDFKNPDLSF